MSLISVIIPVFNCEKYIVRAIDSVLKQTMSDYEIIVINDGSTDETYEVVNNYINDNNVSSIKIISTKNKGVSAARNLGMTVANGDNIVFLDADDWLEDTAFDIWIKLKNSYPNTLISTSKKYVSESTNSISENTFCADERFFTREYYASAMADEGNNLQNASSKLFDRKIIDNNGLHFDEDIAFGEDGLFVFKYALCVDKIIYNPTPLLNAMIRMDSATHISSFNSRWFEGIISVKRMKEMCSADDNVLKKSLGQWEIEKVYSLARRYYANDCSLEYYVNVKKYLKEYHLGALGSNLSIKSKILWSLMRYFPLSIMAKIAKNMDA